MDELWSWVPGWAKPVVLVAVALSAWFTRWGRSVRAAATASDRVAHLEAQVAALTARTEEAEAALAATRVSFQRQIEALTAELDQLRPAAAEAAALRTQLSAVEAECFRLRQLACVTAPGCPKRLPVMTTPTTTTEGDAR